MLARQTKPFTKRHGKPAFSNRFLIPIKLSKLPDDIANNRGIRKSAVECRQKCAKRTGALKVFVSATVSQVFFSTKTI